MTWRSPGKLVSCLESSVLQLKAQQCFCEAEPCHGLDMQASFRYLFSDFSASDPSELLSALSLL